MLKVLAWLGMIMVVALTSEVKIVRLRTFLHATEALSTFVILTIWLFS